MYNNSIRILREFNFLLTSVVQRAFALRQRRMQYYVQPIEYFPLALRCIYMSDAALAGCKQQCSCKCDQGTVRVQLRSRVGAGHALHLHGRVTRQIQRGEAGIEARVGWQRYYLDAIAAGD